MPKLAERATPTSRGPGTVDVDGIPFHAITEPQVVDHVDRALDGNRGGYLITPNVDILRQLQRPELRAVVDRADLVVADGMPVVWASRIAAQPLPERVTGSSLIWSLSAAAAVRGRHVMVLGGAPGVAEQAAARLSSAVTGLHPVGWHFPPFGYENDADARTAITAAIRRDDPQVVFVGLGFPRQELLILDLLDQFPRTWFVACGGSLAMVAGIVDRAPLWLQRVGLEWAHRLVSEPTRLAQRYLVHDLPYAAQMLARAARRRWSVRPA